jgi:hypothetical protein
MAIIGNCCSGFDTVFGARDAYNYVLKVAAARVVLYLVSVGTSSEDSFVYYVLPNSEKSLSKRRNCVFTVLSHALAEPTGCRRAWV